MVSALRGIIAILLLAVGLIGPAFAAPPIPTLTGRVVDDAGILQPATREEITSRLAGLESSTGIQLVVVTLPDLKNYPIEDWGLALGRGWGIGQKGKNNGLLLIVAPNDRELRIEVGYGLEGQIPDATANSIIQQEIIPYFKRGDMDGGVRAGVDGIFAALNGSYQPTQPLKVSEASSSGGGFEDILGPLAIFGFAFGGTVLLSLRRRYDPKRRRNVWYMDTSRWGSSGSSSSGRSSGGGFSGGGGSFGGGGASGRW